MFKSVDDIMWCYHSNETSFAEPLYSQSPLYGHPLNMDTSLLQTVFFVPREKALHSSTFNPLKTNTPLIQIFSLVHSVSILKVSNCIYFFWIINFCDFFELAYCGAYYSDIYLGHKVTGYINRIIIQFF